MHSCVGMHGHLRNVFIYVYCLWVSFSGMAMIDYQLLIGIPRVYRTNSNVCFAELPKVV